MTTWSEEEKATAIGLGYAKGPLEAAKATGIPRRTISSWLQKSSTTTSPAIKAAIVATEAAVAAKLWEMLTLGLDEVRAGLLDPKARLGDKSRAVEVIAAQWQLLTGRATSRSESANLNVNLDADGDGLTDAERTELRSYLETQIAKYEAKPEEEVTP
jgi:hypothetical protein